MIDFLLCYLAVFGCGIGIAFAMTVRRSPKVKLIWYDLWVGAYWDRAKRLLYILPLPCVVFVFDFGGKLDKHSAQVGAAKTSTSADV